MSRSIWQHLAGDKLTTHEPAYLQTNKPVPHWFRHKINRYLGGVCLMVLGVGFGLRVKKSLFGMHQWALKLGLSHE